MLGRGRLVLDLVAGSTRRAVGLTSVGESPGRVPGAGAARVGALVPSEVVDQHAGAVGQVQRTGAARAGARRGRGAVGLRLVLQRAILVIPGACAIGIGTLVPGEKVDQNSSVAIVVLGAGASAGTSGVAADEDGLTRGIISFFERRDIAGSRVRTADEQNGGDEGDETEREETCHCRAIAI